jgi:FkbM family methyltransferase
VPAPIVTIPARTMLTCARAAYQLVNVARGPWRTKQVEVTRDGLRWSLDLREGIDLSIYLFGAFEPSVVRRYRHLVSPGDVVVDIGANVGAHTLPLARAAGESGRVVAFEPTGWAFEKLLANLALNPDLGGRVTAEHALLVSPGQQAVPAEIYSSWPLAVGSGRSGQGGQAELHPQHRGMLRGTDGARAVTLDDYFAGDRQASDKPSRVDFVKLDVDGAEPDVLAGAAATIERHRPAIVIEMAPCAYEGGDGFERIVGFLTSRGYRLEHLRTHRPLPTDADALAARIPDGSSMNVLCVPE